MKRIQKLDEKLIAQIAAGEVIESPAAIVKELLENSLDAGATEISILIEGDGFSQIQVRDNGQGIHSDDLPLAVESFATSKIRSLDELISVRTMGFRGEALGSIASVSRLTLESRQAGSAAGSQVSVDEMGKNTSVSAIEAGTRVVVRDLFYNIPVRRDYYQNVQKIRRNLMDTITGITAVHPEIAFRYEIDQAEPVILPKRDRLIERIADIWGNSIVNDIMPVYFEADGLSLEGFISKFYFYRTFASDSRLWVNSRPVNYKPLTMLLRNAYGELMPKGRFPFAVLYLTLDSRDVDVNVHPQKREIRFKREPAVQNFLRTAFHRAVAGESGGAAGTSGGIRAQNMVRLPTAAGANAMPGQVVDLFEQSAALVPAAQDSRPGLPENLVFHSRIFNTFILASNDQGLYLIDQHTAHERINYEKFLGLLRQKGGVRQALAVPIPVETSVFSRKEITDAVPALANLGFEIADMGAAGHMLRAVPSYIEPGEELAALTAAIENLANDGQIGAGELFDQVAKDLSCRHAIRKGESASLSDFRELYEQLKACENPMRCPHGRPTVVTIDEPQIFSFFKRQA